ncbi:MAG: hypothetical protein IAE87_06980 [Rhodobacteraceae bacterium]|jgi:membrane protein implicated in regulation of membrane protease activity|nr:hypothetical protein [Paracoccaceae bacterium]
MPDQIWTVWWAWIALGVALGVIDLVMPGFIFLGFAIGAAVTGGLIGIGILGSAGLPLVLLVFAVLSLVAWVALIRVLGRRPGQEKIWDRDINDNP